MTKPESNFQPETGPEGGNGSPESPTSWSDCSRAIATALLLEQCRTQNEKAVETAKSDWDEKRELAIRNNPALQKAQNNVETLSRQFLAAKESRSLDKESLKALNVQLNKACLTEASAFKKAIDADPEAVETRSLLREAEKIHKQLESAFPQARKAALKALGRLGVHISWEKLKMQLGPGFRQELLESGRQLEEAADRHERNLAKIPSKLPPREIWTPRSGGKGRSRNSKGSGGSQRRKKGRQMAAKRHS